jgi:hypothetical protein
VAILFRALQSELEFEAAKHVDTNHEVRLHHTGRFTFPPIGKFGDVNLEHSKHISGTLSGPEVSRQLLGVASHPRGQSLLL